MYEARGHTKIISFLIFKVTLNTHKAAITKLKNIIKRLLNFFNMENINSQIIEFEVKRHHTLFLYFYKIDKIFVR
jgi:hypothetical protein